MENLEVNDNKLLFGDSYRNKKLFVTGHTGFKGAWLCLWLHILGAQVTGYALSPPTKPSLFELCCVDDLLNSVNGDVRDLESLRRAMQEAAPDIVIHMAAQSLVGRSYNVPLETYSTNVMGTATVLEAVRETASVKVVLIVTSDKCYENREWVWGYRESDPLGGFDPYSSSKACAELVTAAYRRSFFHANGVAVASARAGNVIGGGDWAEDRLIPDAVRAFTAGKSLRLRNPRATRPWQHVLEPLKGYLMLCERLWHEPEIFSDAWNFGPDEHAVRSVAWVADRFCAMWGGGVCWQQDTDTHPHEASSLRLESTKAYERLGWRPLWNIERALEETARWYRSWQEGADPRTLCLEQIRSFQREATDDV